VPGLRKKPSTSELLDWIRALVASGAELPEEEKPQVEAIPFLGTLVKMNEDTDTLMRQAARPADARTAGRRFFR
jgi:hypothetical protein